MVEEEINQTTTEVENEEVVDTKPKKEKKKHGVLKGFLLFFGGFLTCLVVLGGTMSIVGAFVPVKKVASIFGADVSKLLTEEYANETVFGIIGHASRGDFNFNNLNDLIALTPLIDEYFEKIDDLFYKNFGIHLDKEELYSVAFEDFGDYLANYAKTHITLAGVLKVDDKTDSKVLLYICFKKDADGELDFNNPRSLDELTKQNAMADLLNMATLDDLVDVGESGVLWALRDSTLKSIKDDVNSIQLKDLIGIKDTDKKPLPFIGQYTIDEILNGALKDNATMDDLFDIKEGDLLYNFKDSTMDSLQDDIKKAHLQDIMTIITDKNDPNYNPTLYALRNATLNTIGEDVNNLKVHEMIEINEKSSQVLKYFRDYNDGEGVALKHLDDAVKAMTLGDAVEINSDSPQILKTLATTRITNLSERINDLTLGEAILIDDDSSSVMQNLAGTNINQLDSAINSMPLSQLIGFDEKDPDTPKILRLLSTYTLSNIEANIENIKIKELFTDDGETSTNNKFLDALPDDTTLANFKEKLAQVKVVDAFTEEIWGTHVDDIVKQDGAIVGGYINEATGANTNYSYMDKTWKYMLTSKDSLKGVYLHTEYTLIDNMNDLTKNMQNNISTATVRELYEDEFINITDPGVLDKVIPGEGIPVGDYTIKQLLDALSTVLVDP